MKIKIGVIVILILLGLIFFFTKQEKQIIEKESFRGEVLETINFVGSTDLDDGVYSIDLKNSQLLWSGRTAVKSHDGTVDIAKGSLKILNENTTGNLVFDMATINSDAGAGLDNHLKNEDFFDVETYPTASLVINNYSEGFFDAELTIKDKTINILVPVLINQKDEILIVSGKMEIDRTLWGIEYNSGSFFTDLGDRAISDSIGIEFEIAMIAS